MFHEDNLHFQPPADCSLQINSSGNLRSLQLPVLHLIFMRSTFIEGDITFEPQAFLFRELCDIETLKIKQNKQNKAQSHWCHRNS